MRYIFSLTLGLGSLMLLGCGDSKTSNNVDEKSPAKTQQQAEHEHPDEGLHGGKLIELGDEEYHGEWVVDQEAGTATVYILDGHVENPVPIEAEEITISQESGTTYSLAAKPMEGEPTGKSSRFVSMDEKLISLMDGHFHAKLLLEIEGKRYNGDFDSH